MKKSRKRKFLIFMKKKLALVYLVLVIVFIALVGRLIKLNFDKGEQYAKKVLSQQTYVSNVIPYKRGDIVDRKGTVLATSIKIYNLIIDPKMILMKDNNNEAIYKESTITALTACFKISKSEIEDILGSKSESRYVVVSKDIPQDEMELFLEMQDGKDSKIKGVWFEDDYVRSYPYGTLACNLIGFTSRGNVGNWGIEEYYNESLNGLVGREYGYYDTGLDIVRTLKPAVNGNTIYSTIDVNIQGIVEKNIKKFNEEKGSKSTGVIIMNPNNGEVLAMASYPNFNLNDPRDLSSMFTEEELSIMSEQDKLEILNKIWRNICISDSYEPGSTFKPYTIAMGFEEDRLEGDETYFCTGSEVVVVGEKAVRCNARNGHDLITLEESLMYSCNVALMQIGANIGKTIFSDYQRRFIFGSKTGIDLPGEASGILHNVNAMGPMELAINSFGQTFTVTMIQLISGFCSLVNGGNYYEPHIVKKIVNENGGTALNVESKLLKKTVSKKTSTILNKYLKSTVESGTASHARIEGYSIGGKTGTAEKHPRDEGKYLVSFIGTAPADNPELVIYVTIDEPNDEKQDQSSFATKLAHDILTEVLPYSNIFPDYETPVEDTTENLTEATTEDFEETTEETSETTIN